MSRSPVGSVALSLLLAIVSIASAAPVPHPSLEQVRKELDAAWTDLLSEDEQTAGRALLVFAARRDETVEYLKENLRPLKLTKEQATQLLAALGGGDEKAARAAFEELRYFDPRLALGDKELRDALLDKPVSRRLGALLCDLPIDALSGPKWHWYSPDNKVFRFDNGEGLHKWHAAIGVGLIGQAGRKASWVRAIRAIVVLEFIGTPKARAILDELATGHPDAAPTKAARLARDRLGK